MDRDKYACMEHKPMSSFITMTTNFMRADDVGSTRPDTQPVPVADGWAGAKMHVSPLFDSCSRTDGQTDGQTDGWKKPLIELLVRD